MILVYRVGIVASRIALISVFNWSHSDDERICVIFQEGATALHSAAYNGHKGVVDQLLEDGATINIVTKVGALMFRSFGLRLTISPRLGLKLERCLDWFRCPAGRMLWNLVIHDDVDCA